MSGSMMPRLSFGLLVAIILAMATACLISRVPLNQTDVWLHLAFGEQWLDAGRLNIVELTPIGVPNAPGLNSYWLSQIVIALAWRMGGVAGIQALHAVVVLVRLILLGVLLRLMGCKDRRLVLMVVVTLGLAIGHLPIFRPQIIAELLATPLLLIALWPGSFWWRGILLGLLLGVWSISHGSFLIGIVMVGTVAIGRIVGDSSWRAKTFIIAETASAILISAIIMGLIHPSGLGAVADIIAMGANRAVRTQDEWRPLWSNQSLFPIILWVVSLFWCGWGIRTAWISEKRLPWQSLIPGMAFMLLPLLHQRLLVWWFLMVPILVAAAFKPEEEVNPMPRPGRGWMMVLMAMVAAILLSGPADSWRRGGSDGSRVASATPWELGMALRNRMDPLEANQMASGRVFVSESLGDHLVWRWKPRAPVLLHSHVHLLPPEHYQACLGIKFGVRGWDQQLSQWGVDLVLVEALMHPTLCEKIRISEDWRVVVDEHDNPGIDRRSRLFLAVRPGGNFSDIGPEVLHRPSW